MTPPRFTPPPSLTDRDPKAVRARIEAMEKILERLFVIPGTNREVGLDAILSLIPTVGSVSAAALGSYIMWEARIIKRHLDKHHPETAIIDVAPTRR